MAGLGLLEDDPRYPRYGAVQRAPFASMSSANEPLADWIAQYLGPDAGHYANRGIGMARNFAREATMLPQMIRAGESGARAASNPSIPNLTDAGVNTSMALLRPLAALKIGSAGLAAAVAKDFGAGDIMGSNAYAQAKKGKAASEVPDLPGLTPEQNARYKALGKQMMEGNFGSSAERRAIESEAGGLRDLSQQFQLLNMKNSGAADADRKKSEQAEFDRAVSKAETVRDKELGRQRRFSDTEVGQTWDKLGGWGPFIAAGALGGLSRVATGGGKNLYNYGLPAAEGAIGGALSTNVPLAYNAFMTEPDNPEKRAYAAYARELPPTHPRKQEWETYAAKLPNANPVREAASEELYDPKKAAERMIFGSIEGVGGGLAGANLVRAPGMVVEGLSRYPGRAKAGYQGSMAAGDKASAARNAAADDYAAAAKEANDALLKKRAQAAASPPAPPTPVEPIAPPAIDPTAAAGNSPAARARRYMNTF